MSTVTTDGKGKAVTGKELRLQENTFENPLRENPSRVKSLAEIPLGGKMKSVPTV